MSQPQHPGNEEHRGKAVSNIVVGCGRFGAELANRLFESGIQVTVIDRNASAFDQLTPDFRGRTLEGDVLTQDLLHRCGIEQAQGLAAVTNSDSVNAVVGHIARQVYRVPTVVVRNYDPRWRPLHEAFDLQVVSSSSWGAQRIEEMLSLTNIRSVFVAGNGEVAVYEMSLPSWWQGHTLGELLAGTDCALVALTRAGRATVPTPEISITVGDVLHISASQECIRLLQARLARR